MKTIDQIAYTGLHSKEGNARMTPMSRSETDLFLKLTMGEMSKGSGPPEKGSPEDKLRDELLKETITKIITSRITGSTGLPWEEVVSFSALAFIGCLDVIENPAQCVLWAYTLVYMRAAEGEVIDMNLLAQWFPVGFPPADYYRDVWDKQKGYMLQVENCDNFLDRGEWWQELAAIINKSTERPTMGPARPPVDTSDIVEVDSEDEIHAPTHEA
jgi:hypothetical protein